MLYFNSVGYAHVFVCSPSYYGLVCLVVLLCAVYVIVYLFGCLFVVFGAGLRVCLLFVFGVVVICLFGC